MWTPTAGLFDPAYRFHSVAMCGRYTLAEGKGDWEIAHIRIEWKGSPRYNIAPSQRAPVIRLAEGLPTVKELHWGLVPS